MTDLMQSIALLVIIVLQNITLWRHRIDIEELRARMEATRSA